MARFDIEWPDEWQKKLQEIPENLDQIAPKMIDEATPIVVTALQHRLSRHKRTGELIHSIKAGKAKAVRGGGYYGYVTAVGTAAGKVYRRKKSNGDYKHEDYRNYQKMLALEYGTSKQAPSPFLQAAVNDAQADVINKMQEVFTREVENR